MHLETNQTFVDKGVMRRALCAIGTQDMGIEEIIPIDQNITLVGISSDYLILMSQSASMTMRWESLSNST